MLEWRSHTIQDWDDFSILQKEGEAMSKFFLTLDAHGLPLPIYENQSDINTDYKKVYDTIQKSSRDK
jgi:hypothetical protein